MYVYAILAFCFYAIVVTGTILLQPALQRYALVRLSINIYVGIYLLAH